MPKLIPNLFTKYEFTEAEAVQGSIFTAIQKQMIQTKIAELAEEKCSLKFDPTTPHSFIQREAELQGQINSLQWIIALSESAEADEIVKNSPRINIPQSKPF